MDTAFANACEYMVGKSAEHGVSAVVIAGDIFDTPSGNPDALICATRQIRKLLNAGLHVLAIAGNHDTPTVVTKTPLIQALASAFEEDERFTFAYESVVRKVIGDTEFVLLPHMPMALSSGCGKEDIAPDPSAGKHVLVVHGVAAGDPALRQMDEAKEMPVAADLLRLGWDYVAFGHFHKPGRIPVAGTNAWYCGSLENTVVSGPDVCMRRGPVLVDTDLPAEDGKRFAMHQLPIRPIMSAASVDALGGGMAPDDIVSAMEASIRALGNTEDAIINISVDDITPAQIRAMPPFDSARAFPDALAVNIRMNRHEETEEAAGGPAVEKKTITDEETGEEREVFVDSEGVEHETLEEALSTARHGIRARGISTLANEADAVIKDMVESSAIREELVEDVKRHVHDFIAEATKDARK